MREINRRVYALVLEVISITKELRSLKEFELSNQLFRSATSIGANLEESISASSKKDFRNKLNIALKEARETRYWLRITKDITKIDLQLIEENIDELEEIIKILFTIHRKTPSS